MGNLIMPKQTAKLDVFYFSLQCLYESHSRGEFYLTNSDFKTALINNFDRFDNTTNSAMLVKQSEMVRYFGLANYDYVQRRTSITQRGINFYNAYINNELNICKNLLMESVMSDSFGRNNTAIESSNSNIDPPKLFLKAIIDLDGITRTEFPYLLTYTHNLCISYDDACDEIRRKRNGQYNNSIQVLALDANRYSDCKFIPFFENMGICYLDNENKYLLSPYIENNFHTSLHYLSIYNMEPEFIRPSLSLPVISTSNISADNDCDSNYKETVANTLEYDLNSAVYRSQNERTPSLGNGIVHNHRYHTDARLGKTALMIAEYNCEFDVQHKTFISKSGNNFTEAHHLIPMIAQRDFDINLDRTENIVSLCPNCHSAVHYGRKNERKKILSEIYNKKIEMLNNLGIDISLDDLLNKYYK